MTVARRLIIPMLLASTVAGCKSEEVLRRQARRSAPVVAEVPVEGLPRSRPSQTGMELLTWHVSSTPELDRLLEGRAVPALETADRERLERNAMLVLRCRESALRDLLVDIEGINASMSAWCGQVTDWLDVRDIRFRSRVLRIEGERRLFDSGKLGLATRAWVEPTLEAARLHVELVPRFQAERGTYSSLLRRERPKSVFVEGLATRTELGPGEVLLLTCAAPPAAPAPPTPFVGPPIGEEPDPDDDPTLDNPIPTPSTRIGDQDLIGHALFEIPGESPERIVLVLVPRFPSTMLPTARVIGESRTTDRSEITP